MTKIDCYTGAIWPLFIINNKISIPPILHEDKFVTDFQVKSEIFNSHFAKQCSLLKNESQIPPQLLPHTNTCLSTVRFSENDILKVIQKLDPNKAHGHDKISIRMLKLSDKAICKPLHMIFTSCLVFLDISKAFDRV